MQIKKSVIFLTIVLTLSSIFSGCYQERTRVKFWTFVQGQELHILRGLVAKFNYSNPDCELQLKVFKSSLDYYQSFKQKSSRKKGPDLVYMVDGWIRQFAQKGYLRAIKNEKAFSSLNKWDHKVIDELRVRNGRLYCIPDSMNYYLKLTSNYRRNNLLMVVDPVEYYRYSSQLKLDFKSFTSWINSLKKTQRLSFKRVLEQGYEMVGETLILPLDQLSKIKGNFIASPLTNSVFGCYAVTSRSKDVEESIRFIKFMNEEKNLLRFIKIGKRFNLRSDFRGVPNNLVNNYRQKFYTLVPVKRQIPQLKSMIQSYFGRSGLDLGVKN